MPQPNSSTAARWQPTCKCAARPRTFLAPPVPGLTPEDGGSPHLHNARSYYVCFLTCLPKCVGAELPPPPPTVRAFPGREGGARLARQQTPHHPYPIPTPLLTVTGTELGLLTLTSQGLNFFNELCIHECMTGLQAPCLQFACFYFRQCFNRSNCKYIHF